MVCIILSCKSDPARKPEKAEIIIYHRFPVEKKIKEKWLRVIPTVKDCRNTHPCICSKHFEESCFVSGGKHKGLKFEAVPSLYLHTSTHTSKESHKVATERMNQLLNFECNVPLCMEEGKLQQTLNLFNKLGRSRPLKMNKPVYQTQKLQKRNLEQIKALDEKNKEKENEMLSPEIKSVKEFVTVRLVIKMVNK